MLESIRRYPDDHVVWKRDLYTRSDGALLVYRDGLTEQLHRRLYRLAVDPELKRKRLRRTCDRWGCQNPKHFEVSGETDPRARAACAKGHAYTDENTDPTGHCRTCADARRAARAPRRPDAAERNAAKDACPYGHAYDAKNTYLYIGERGVHRKCRLCNAERARQRRRHRAH